MVGGEYTLCVARPLESRGGNNEIAATSGKHMGPAARPSEKKAKKEESSRRKPISAVQGRAGQGRAGTHRGREATGAWVGGGPKMCRRRIVGFMGQLVVFPMILILFFVERCPYLRVAY